MCLEGVYETDNSIYIILEHLEGMQLNDLLKVHVILFRVGPRYRLKMPRLSSKVYLRDFRI